MKSYFWVKVATFFNSILIVLQLLVCSHVYFKQRLDGQGRISDLSFVCKHFVTRDEHAEFRAGLHDFLLASFENFATAAGFKAKSCALVCRDNG